MSTSHVTGASGVPIFITSMTVMLLNDLDGGLMPSSNLNGSFNLEHTECFCCRRARFLLAGAHYIVNDCDGVFPTTALELKKIPGELKNRWLRTYTLTLIPLNVLSHQPLPRKDRALQACDPCYA